MNICAVISYKNEETSQPSKLLGEKEGERMARDSEFSFFNISGRGHVSTKLKYMRDGAARNTKLIPLLRISFAITNQLKLKLENARINHIQPGVRQSTRTLSGLKILLPSIRKRLFFAA